MTKKAFQFPKKHNLPFYFVSAADGTNVVKVRGAMRCGRPSHGPGVCTSAKRALGLG